MVTGDTVITTVTVARHVWASSRGNSSVYLFGVPPLPSGQGWVHCLAGIDGINTAIAIYW